MCIQHNAVLSAKHCFAQPVFCNHWIMNVCSKHNVQQYNIRSVNMQTQILQCHDTPSPRLQMMLQTLINVGVCVIVSKMCSFCPSRHKHKRVFDYLHLGRTFPKGQFFSSWKYCLQVYETPNRQKELCYVMLCPLC